MPSGKQDKPTTCYKWDDDW